MAEPRSRRTGEYNAQIVKLQTDVVQMQAQLVALHARVERLESELIAARKPAKAAVVPPPLPPVARPSPALPKSQGRRSIVDISEIAELVESPPSTRTPRK